MAVVIHLLLGLLIAAPPAAERPGEYEVKAAYLYNFARYVEWPASPSGPEPGTFVITILGPDPFGAAIDRTLAGKVVEGRRVVIQRASTPEDLGPSHIVFIADSHRDDVAVALRRLEGTATLTVGETERFGERGGAIRFRTEGERVRLEINPAAAQRAGLKVSSELLKLARIVRAAAPR